MAPNLVCNVLACYEGGGTQLEALFPLFPRQYNAFIVLLPSFAFADSSTKPLPGQKFCIDSEGYSLNAYHFHEHATEHISMFIWTT